MLFLVAYCIFEVPSNLALKTFSPRRWLAFLVIAFGAFCTGIGGTTNAAGVTALRFCLGAAEAGVFPGMIYYFSFWYKPEERASRIAAFLASATLSGAFGGCIAYGVGHMNGAGGLAAWRWLFILEGIPSSESMNLSTVPGQALTYFPRSHLWRSNLLFPAQLPRAGRLAERRREAAAGQETRHPQQRQHREGQVEGRKGGSHHLALLRPLLRLLRHWQRRDFAVAFLSYHCGWTRV